MAAAVRLPEHNNKQIPCLNFEEPSRQFALLPRAMGEAISDSLQRDRRFRDRDLRPHRIKREAAAQLPFHTRSIAGERHKLVVGIPTYDLQRVLSKGWKCHGNINNANLHSSLREVEPERPIAEPAGCHALQAHGRGVPLDMMINT